MCCRYWADESPEIREIVEEMNGSPLVSKWQKTTGITTFGEVRPTNVVPVMQTDTGEPILGKLVREHTCKPHVLITISFSGSPSQPG